MALTFWTLAAWYGLAVVIALLGLAAERRDRGESAASAVRSAARRLRARTRGAPASVAPARVAATAE
jgi:hypothetical protein